MIYDIGERLGCLVYICIHDPGENWWVGKNVVELGAGTGAVGLACCILGSNVVLTDIGPHVNDGSAATFYLKSWCGSR